MSDECNWKDSERWNVLVEKEGYARFCSTPETSKPVEDEEVQGERKKES